jgi:hypothetical protein
MSPTRKLTHLLFRIPYSILAMYISINLWVYLVIEVALRRLGFRVYLESDLSHAHIRMNRSDEAQVYPLYQCRTRLVSSLLFDLSCSVT